MAWNSAAFTSSVETFNLRVILIQAASFSLFLVMSEAWNEAFSGLLSLALPEEDQGIVFSFTRAVASTVFCVGLLFLIICLSRCVYSKEEGKEGCRVCCCLEVV